MCVDATSAEKLVLKDCVDDNENQVIFDVFLFSGTWNNFTIFFFRNSFLAGEMILKRKKISA